MREISVTTITDAIAQMCIEVNERLSPDMEEALRRAAGTESNSVGQMVMETITKNLEIARDEHIPICQDTGMTVVFIDIGQEVCLTDGDLTAAVNAGVAKGYTEGYLRASVVSDPFDRVNTGDNTPAVIHTCIVPGDQIKVTIAPKGAGSENMSAMKMLKPADGIGGVREYVLEVIRTAGPNPCPPLVVGVGVGGNFETAPLMAKRALLRSVGDHAEDPAVRELEEELLKEANDLGIGPAGLGGDTTVLAVHVETAPTHIAQLPVAVAICCHVNRHISRVL